MSQRSGSSLRPLLILTAAVSNSHRHTSATSVDGAITTKTCAIGQSTLHEPAAYVHAIEADHGMAGLAVSVFGKVQPWACEVLPDAAAEPGLAATFTLQDHTTDLRTDVLACASAVASHHVAVGDAVGVVHVLDGTHGSVRTTIQPVRDGLGATVAMQWARRAPVLAIGWDSGAVGCWHMDLAAWVAWLPCHWQSPCTALAWAPDDSCLYAGYANGTVNLWDTYVTLRVCDRSSLPSSMRHARGHEFALA